MINNILKVTGITVAFSLLIIVTAYEASVLKDVLEEKSVPVQVTCQFDEPSTKKVETAAKVIPEGEWVVLR